MVTPWMIKMSEPLTIESLMLLWESKLLPSIKSKISAQIDGIKTNLEEQTQRLAGIEKSQEFLSKQYDDLMQNFNNN